MNTVSFMSANFIARQVAYHMPQGWDQGDKATNEWFRPLDTFGDRFDAMLGEIAQLGFDAIDVHMAHLNYLWTTPEHLEIARSLLAKHKLRVVSYAGWFGRSEVVFRSACRLASTLNIPVLGGDTPLLKDNRDALVSILREFGITFGLENHSEKTPEELLANLGEGDEDVIGVTVDTGWFSTRGCNAAEALRWLAPRLKHVHLKDVKARRTEKPVAMRFRDARSLAKLAKRQNRRLSCAPVTWLGEAQQTAWKVIRSGQIGTPRVVYAEVNWARMEKWHPKPQPFYEAGPVFDVAVYPLTLLTAWFGAVRRVTAGGKTVMPARTTKEGKPFTVTTPDWQAAVLEFESGLIARMTASFYVGMPTRTREGMEIHGDAGSLILDQWTAFDSPVRLGKFGQEAHRLPLEREPFQGIEFGRGVVELAAALRENRPHRNGVEHAAHVVEVMEAILTSVKAGKAVKVKSSFPAPAPMPWAE